MEKKECLNQSCCMRKLQVETDKTVCISCGGKLVSILAGLFEMLGKYDFAL